MEFILVKQDSAQAMMDKLGHEGLLVDGRKLFFEYRYTYFIFVAGP